MSGVRYSPKLRARILSGDWPDWLHKHPRQRYIVQSLCARVPWGEEVEREIKRIYADAKARGLYVDHIVPLCHPDVCGLTVPANLQAITPKANAAKGNKWHPDQLELDL